MPVIRVDMTAPGVGARFLGGIMKDAAHSAINLMTVETSNAYLEVASAIDELHNHFSVHRTFNSYQDEKLEGLIKNLVEKNIRFQTLFDKDTLVNKLKGKKPPAPQQADTTPNQGTEKTVVDPDLLKYIPFATIAPSPQAQPQPPAVDPNLQKYIPFATIATPPQAQPSSGQPPPQANYGPPPPYYGPPPPYYGPPPPYYGQP